MGIPVTDSKSFAQAALPHITKKDLQEESAWALNHVLNDILWKQITALAGGAGPINLRNTVIAPAMSIPSQTQPPTDNSAVLTLGAALQLFSPQSFRPALVSGAFQTNSTSVQGAQPLPLGGSSASGLTATVSFPGGFTISGVTYFNMLFSNGVLTGVS